MLRQVAVFQMDSVNVLVRSHYLPLYSRVGPYPPSLLERAAYRAPRELFEYWGHEASLLPVSMQPLFRWRMERAANEARGNGPTKRTSSSTLPNHDASGRPLTASSGFAVSVSVTARREDAPRRSARAGKFLWAAT